MRIYISSTYLDLREYRAAAARAARKRFPDVRCMEDYRAREDAPLPVCLRDVAQSDVYVGIFAWRFGFKPPGETESITALEYRQAVRLEKRCFIFLLDETVGWPDEHRDADPTEIARLRAELADRHVVSFFRNPDHLFGEVSSALADLSVQADVPELLPWLADRESQERELHSLLDRAESSSVRRPCFVVIHGSEREAHSSFIRRLARHTLPQCVSAAGTAFTGVREYPTPWPSSPGTLDQRESDLLFATARALGLPTRDSTAVREAWLARHRGPVLVFSTLHTAEWQDEEERLIDRWARYWSEWPEPPLGRPLIVVLAVLYQLPNGILDRFRLPRRLHRIRAQLEGIVARLEGMLHAHVLPELGPVSANDLNDWVDRHVPRWIGESAANLRRLEALRAHARELFRSLPSGESSSRLPMEVVGRRLHEALSSLLATAR